MSRIVSASGLGHASDSRGARRGWRLHTNFQVIRTMHTGEMVVFAVGFFDDVLVERDGHVVVSGKDRGL